MIALVTLSYGWFYAARYAVAWIIYLVARYYLDVPVILARALNHWVYAADVLALHVVIKVHVRVTLFFAVSPVCVI